MKLAFIAASIAATTNIQANKIGATCQTGTDAVENLVIEIPYPDERTALLLSLEAGDCDATNYRGSVTWASDVATVTIPIDACNMRGELYGTPVVARSYGLYRPTATVTFGQRIGEMDVIFRSLPIAAECGKKTSYTVEFNYNNVTSADTEDCTIIDGVCVFPAYTDDAVFAIKEYTDDTSLVEVGENNRANVAGTQIYLSMQVTGLSDEAKFAVTECKVVDGDNELVLLNPGAETNPTCKIDELGLSADYEKRGGDYFFNFQHVLFLLRSAQQTGSSTFRLECSVQICKKNDASSKCNSAAKVCVEAAAGDDTSLATTEKHSYMCDSFCTNSAECAVESDVPSCKVCTCANGVGATGAECPTHDTAFCASCTTGFALNNHVCADDNNCDTLINPPDSSRTNSNNGIGNSDKGMIDSARGFAADHGLQPWDGDSTWMIIDSGLDMSINGVAIQGRAVSSTHEWMKSFTVQYWMDGETVADAKDVDGGAHFNVQNRYSGQDGIYNSIHFTAGSLRGRYFKIIVQTWNSRPTMRVGLLGCSS